MPKLAIYVPKRDMRQIEAWRKKINFSKVFMKALMAEIRAMERSTKRTTSDQGQLARAAEYYQCEMIEEGADVLVDRGFALGRQHVLDCRLSATTIRQLLKIDSADRLSTAESAQVVELLGDAMRGVDQLAEKHGFDDTSRPLWEQAVYRGYLKGVAAAWQEVCEQMHSKKRKA